MDKLRPNAGILSGFQPVFQTTGCYDILTLVVNEHADHIMDILEKTDHFL